MVQHLTLTAEDGHHLDAYRSAPAGEPKGAIVVVLSVFRDELEAPRWHASVLVQVPTCDATTNLYSRQVVNARRK